MIDRFTRWVEAVPISDITAETVARTFVHSWIARFGVLLRITQDRGAQFASKLWADVSSLLGCANFSTAAFYPQSNVLLSAFITAFIIAFISVLISAFIIALISVLISAFTVLSSQFSSLSAQRSLLSSHRCFSISFLSPLESHRCFLNLDADHIPDHISDYILDPIFDHILDHYF
ncbi:Integrase catalytic core [Trinorchestia longiramus]|nr:Integrase catalytic core [Trinorchestia longiramus]